MNKPAIYDRIGKGYAAKRRADPRWETRINQALLGANKLVNVGAGAGSYEPPGADLIAVEPSQTMIEQRPFDAAPVVQGVAECLPFKDGQFDVALAILTTHHWSDAAQGLAELARVSHRQVIVTWDADYFVENFWLVRDYVPQISDRERALPTLATVQEQLQITTVETLAIPADFTDGIFASHWARPEAYLEPDRRAAMSGLALMDQKAVDAAMRRLENDIQDGTWTRRYAELLEVPAADLGFRLVTAAGAAI